MSAVLFILLMLEMARRHENTNGLLRQFLPTGADLSLASQTMLNDIARLLRGWTRKTLDWRTPEEVMAEEIAQF